MTKCRNSWGNHLTLNTLRAEKFTPYHAFHAEALSVEQHFQYALLRGEGKGAGSVG